MAATLKRKRHVVEEQWIDARPAQFCQCQPVSPFQHVGLVVPCAFGSCGNWKESSTVPGYRKQSNNRSHLLPAPSHFHLRQRLQPGRGRCLQSSFFFGGGGFCSSTRVPRQVARPGTRPQPASFPACACNYKPVLPCALPLPGPSTTRAKTKPNQTKPMHNTIHHTLPY